MDFGAIFNNPMTLFGLGLTGICALGLFIWFFWDRISKRFKGAEKAPVLLLKKGPNLEDTKLLVDNIFYLSNDKTKEAWSYHPDAIQFKMDGNTAGVLLTHDSCMPQFPASDLDMKRMYEELKTYIRPITLSQFLSAIEDEIIKNSISPLAEWMGLAVMAAVGGVLVIIIIMLVPYVKNAF